MSDAPLPEKKHTTLLTRRLFLMAIVLVEVVVGGSFLLWFNSSKIRNRILGVETTIVKLDKDDFVFPDDSELKYYYEPSANSQHDDKPYWLPYTAHYSSNADGLNDVNNYNVEKLPETFRILTLGDSFTYGLFVDTMDAWPKQLEVQLNERLTAQCPWKQVEVLNLGVSGFDTRYVIERYKRKGVKYQADLVLWFESETGFYRYNEEMKPYINNCLEEKVNNVVDPDERRDAEKKCFDDAHFAVAEKLPEEELFSTILTRYYDEFFDLVSQHQFKMYTFEQNTTFTSWSRLKERYPEVTFLATIPNIAEKGEVVADGHPSVEGHATIANSIFQDLKQDHPECFE